MFTRGANLDDTASYFGAISLLATYNGAAFGLPLARREWGEAFRGVHVDLRKMLRN